MSRFFLTLLFLAPMLLAPQLATAQQADERDGDTVIIRRYDYRESDDVREAAIKALAASARREAISVLIELAQTAESAGVRDEVIEALGRLPNQPAEAATRIADALMAVATSDADADLRAEAAESLGQRDDLPDATFDRATEMLSRLALDDTAPSDVRGEAAEALEDLRREARLLPSDTSVERLTEIARSDAPESLRTEAVRRLAQSTDPAAFEALSQIARGQ